MEIFDQCRHNNSINSTSGMPILIPEQAAKRPPLVKATNTLEAWIVEPSPYSSLITYGLYLQKTKCCALEQEIYSSALNFSRPKGGISRPRKGDVHCLCSCPGKRNRPFYQIVAAVLPKRSSPIDGGILPLPET